MRAMRSVVVWLLVILLPLAALAAKSGNKQENEEPEEDSVMSEKTFKGLAMRGIGPALMAGRIADLAVHPEDPSTWYVAVGSGGLWRTDNSGTTWKPVFDDQGSYSIGCVTLDPNNPAVVWVGSGENVSGRHVGYGDGVYRSRDGGASWENLGLKESEYIGSIVIDPRDSNVVYVAAQGPLWSAGGERGLYKSVDGGASWEKILGGGEYTGVNEVVIDPSNPDVLYAATHQRFRNVAALIDGGPESGIHKSTDAGKSWRELKAGLPEEDMGKIGLAVSPQRPEVVYATIELAHREGGFWRSADGGETWEKRNDYFSGGTGPHYYQEIFASPHAFDRVYQADVQLHVTHDGGRTFQAVGEKDKHVDNHAVAFHPTDPDWLLVGCDGGLYESWDLGKNWRFHANLPVTQFYKVAVDYDEPFYNVYGGTQDNNTQGGPSRTNNVHGIRNSDWWVPLFADGHQPAVDPTNPDIIYAQWQQGNLSRVDRRTGEVIYIQPQPGKGEEYDRYNWDAPVLISPHDPARLYHGSQRVWRSDDRGDSWRPISGDLTRGLDRLVQPMMERVWSFDAVWDFLAMSQYGTITSLAESPLVEALFYAGTDDGLIQVTEDGGESWRRLDRMPGVEAFFYVNDIKADLHDADTVYAALDRHKFGDFSPYLFKSVDRGRTWNSIAGDLPERHVVWRLVQDHVDPDLLFVGTEFGVFFSRNDGENWIKLSGGAPNIPFRDLAIQKRENDLVGASFGRSFYILDDYTPLRGISEQVLEREAVLFPVRKALWYLERRPLGGSEKASQGGAFFTAPNPPFGAVFTYYLKDAIRTRKETRREREKEIEEEGGDTPYSGWDEIRRESREKDPLVVLTVRDTAGHVVRRLTGPVGAGFHRVAWDLRYPSTRPWQPKDRQRDPWEDREPIGFLAAPGSYTVGLGKTVDGEYTELGMEQSFEVVSIVKGTLDGASHEEYASFMQELASMQSAVLGAREAIDESVRKLGAIQEALLRSRVSDARLDEEAEAMERRLRDLSERLMGDRRRGRMGDPGPVSVSRRLNVAVSGTAQATYGPTATHLRGLQIAREELAEIRGEVERLIGTELPALEARLDEAGVPWTPGRGVPSLE